VAISKIDKDAAADSLFGHIKQTRESEKNKAPRKALEIKELPNEEVKQSPVEVASQWPTHERQTIILTIRQKEELDRLAKQIMRSRPRHTFQKVTERERITANTLIRALIDIFLEKGEFPVPPEINNEEETKLWLKTLLFE
jgi:hypothetical protein